MAHMTITGFDDVDKMLAELVEKSGQIGIKAVDAAAPKLKESARRAIHAAANKGYATGRLERSIEATKAKENQWGAYSVIKPVGSNEKGVRYSEEAAYLEYGTARGQSPSPWRDKAIASANSDCEQTMEDTVYSEVSKITGGLD